MPKVIDMKPFLTLALIICFIDMNAQASLSVYQQLYIPIYTSGTDQSPELKVVQGTFITPDWLVFEAAILPYYVHSIGYQFVNGIDDSKEGYNINPASTMNLKIISSDLDYGKAEDCNVMLDITDMKQTDDKEIREQMEYHGNNPRIEKITVSTILEKVVIAMEKNLAAIGYKHSCGFSIKGMEKHPEIKKNMQSNSPLLKTKLNIEAK